MESLIEKTELSDLEQREKDSVLGSLRWLKKESISQAGKRLVAARLGAEARYQDLSPPEFFAKCYTLRSNLVHGNKPFPSFEEVGALSAPLEVFVSDLLTWPYAPKR